MKLHLLNNLQIKILTNSFILFILLLNSDLLFSQNNETSNWYFGEYAGLNFELEQNPALLQDSEMLAPAGCSSISDVNGNLLFYTNSETIWNKNHEIMANGQNIMGNINSVQNSIIIPILNFSSLYYLLTVNSDGFYLSKIDMSLNNGLGEVIELNTSIEDSSGFGKITAVHHADGASIWVMTTKTDEDDQSSVFYTYKISADGVISNPIATNLFFNGSEKGVIKFSPNGKKLALTNYFPNSVVNHLFLFKFNNSTGVISDKTVKFTTLAFFDVVSAYGIEFSNDSNKLYSTVIRQGSYDISISGVPEGSEKTTMLYQYNLEGNSPSDDLTILYSEENHFPGSLQIGKNGKIYRAISQNLDDGLNYLGLINEPNDLGLSSNYSHVGTNLNPDKSRLGLPNFIQSYFRTRIINENICADETAVYEVDSYAQITDAAWDFGDGNTSSLISPNYTYINPGSFNISVTITVNNRQITTSKNIRILENPSLSSNQQLIQCDTDSDGISVFNLNTIREKITDPELNEEFVFFETYEDAWQDTNSITNTESYTSLNPYQEIFVRVYNANNCSTITSFILNAIFVDLMDLPNFYVCENSNNIIGDEMGTFSMLEIRNDIRSILDLPDATTLELYPSLIDAQTTVNEIRASFTSESTTIWVRAEESNFTCSGLSPINLIVIEPPIINLEDNYTFCEGIPLILSGDPSNTRFEWLDGNGNVLSTLRNFSVSDSGSYTHIAYKTQHGIECSSSKTFTLIQNEPPLYERIDIDLNYDNNTISVFVIGNSNYEFSMNGIDYFYENSNSYIFFHVPSGIHTVYVRDTYLCDEPIKRTLQLIGYPKFFTPNDDGVNDFWRIKGIDDNNYKSIKIFNRYGKFLISLNHQNAFSWNGRVNNVNLPTNDYWFRVEYSNGDEKTGHFTLKR